MKITDIIFHCSYIEILILTFLFEITADPQELAGQVFNFNKIKLICQY
jgi:hypothetical protein